MRSSPASLAAAYTRGALVSEAPGELGIDQLVERAELGGRVTGHPCPDPMLVDHCDLEALAL